MLLNVMLEVEVTYAIGTIAPCIAADAELN
jgi:hypothetical protein